MEELLSDAAMRGDLESLDEIIEKDNYILDKVLVGSFKRKNPLHLAISTGQREFVLRLLKMKPQLAEVVDKELGAALHIASANGDLKIVEALVELSPEMCMACDRDGNNPLHIAAMKGKVDVLKKLIKTCPCAAQVMVNGGNTILHLCVNYNQLGSLKLLLEKIRDPEFVQSKDANGNTILHVAVLRKRLMIIDHVLARTEIDVHALNGSGWMAMDICSFVQHQEEVDLHIHKLLHSVGAKPQKQICVVSTPSQQKLQQTIMVVASLFATMAFQVGVNPPGGVWQDDSKHPLAGKAILAYKYPISYSCFMCFNTVGFLMSLALILLLLVIAVPSTRSPWGRVLPVMSLLTIMTTAFAYAYSIMVVSPKHIMAVAYCILFSVVVWACVMLLLSAMIASAKNRGRLMQAPWICRLLSRDIQWRGLFPNAGGDFFRTQAGRIIPVRLFPNRGRLIIPVV